MMTLSTAHIAIGTVSYLGGKECAAVAYKKGEYGWFIHIPDENLREYFNNIFPADLLRVMEFAQRFKCDWLCLDRDADEVDFLPRYEW